MTLSQSEQPRKESVGVFILTKLLSDDQTLKGEVVNNDGWTHFSRPICVMSAVDQNIKFDK